MDEDVRHESYKGHEIKSSPVSVALPGSDNEWQVRMYLTSPDGVARTRLLDNPFYKNMAGALEAGLKWGREIIDGELKPHASS